MDDFIFFQEEKKNNKRKSKDLAIKNVSLHHTKAKLCASVCEYKT